jgi:hypothetical protein
VKWWRWWGSLDQLLGDVGSFGDVRIGRYPNPNHPPLVAFVVKKMLIYYGMK